MRDGARWGRPERLVVSAAVLFGVSLLAEGCGGGGHGNTASTDGTTSTTTLSPAPSPSTPGSTSGGPQSGGGVTVTSGDGYRYRIQAGVPQLVTQVDDPNPPGSFPGAPGNTPAPGSGTYFVAVPITVTAEGSGDSPELDNELFFAAAIPTADESAWGITPNATNDCAGDSGLPSNLCELGSTGAGALAAGIYVASGGQDLYNSPQVTLSPGSSKSYTLYVTTEGMIDTAGNLNGFAQSTPLSDLQLYYEFVSATGAPTPTNITEVPLG